ncbi:MAG: 2,3-diketo-5-methylthiopentyl-1-phosphate enolase [Cyanobacteria bacterium]|nr:2,3-diketo-5-methylthiopentyl-1-phosphate enolase [Cyanobacteriota bacterium]
MTLPHPSSTPSSSPLNSPATGVRVTYRMETDAKDLDAVARHIAVGQTLGTSDPIAHQEYAGYLAQVVNVQEVNQITQRRYALITIEYPLVAVQSDIGTLLTVIFGKVSMSGPIRLVGIECPPGLFLSSPHFPGPRFGMEGVRQKLGLESPEIPLLMSIFKPCLGVPPDRLGQWMEAQVLGGMNLVKDDEILSDPDFNAALRRQEACLQGIDRAYQACGRKALYAISLTGPAHEMIDRAKTLARGGAQCFLFNYLSYGLPLLASLAQEPALKDIVLMAHPAMAGCYYGSPAHGIEPQVLFGTLPRLAGADLVLFPSPYGSVALPMEDALAVANHLKAPHSLMKASFPVPSAGIKASMVPDILKDFGTQVVINAGTGIHDHPEGSFYGAQQFVSALDKALPGYSQMPVQSSV